MRTARHVAPLLLLVLCAACASAPKASPQEHYLTVLKGANATYEETMLAAGRAYRDGLIDQAKLDQVRSAGRAAEVALRAGKASLEAWVALGDPDLDIGTGQAIVDVQNALLALLHVWAATKGGA